MRKLLSRRDRKLYFENLIGEYQRGFRDQLFTVKPILAVINRWELCKILLQFDILVKL